MSTVYNTYVVPVVAAGAAIPLAMPLLERKSAMQTEAKFPGPGGIMRGVKISPTIAKIVGTQKLVQNVAAAGNKWAFGWERDDNKSVYSSALLAAMCTTGFFADFNKSTMTGDVKPVTMGQRGIVVLREMPFLLIEPTCKTMQKEYGGNPVSDAGCAFVSGMMGSITGHAQDTAFTRLQKGMPIPLSSLIKGVGYRALGLGVFNVGYDVVSKLIKV